MHVELLMVTAEELESLSCNYTRILHVLIYQEKWSPINYWRKKMCTNLRNHYAVARRWSIVGYVLYFGSVFTAYHQRMFCMNKTLEKFCSHWSSHENSESFHHKQIAITFNMVPYRGFLMRSYIFVNYYLAALYFGAIDSVWKYVPIKIHFDEWYAKLFYRRALGTSIKSTLTALESHLAMLFLKNRLATKLMCIKQSESSNNRSYVARP